MFLLESRFVDIAPEKLAISLAVHQFLVRVTFVSTHRATLSVFFLEI